MSSRKLACLRRSGFPTPSQLKPSQLRTISSWVACQVVWLGSVSLSHRHQMTIVSLFKQVFGQWERVLKLGRRLKCLVSLWEWLGWTGWGPQMDASKIKVEKSHWDDLEKDAEIGTGGQEASRGRAEMRCVDVVWERESWTRIKLNGGRWCAVPSPLPPPPNGKKVFLVFFTLI